MWNDEILAIRCDSVKAYPFSLWQPNFLSPSRLFCGSFVELDLTEWLRSSSEFALAICTDKSHVLARNPTTFQSISAFFSGPTVVVGAVIQAAVFLFPRTMALVITGGADGEVRRFETLSKTGNHGISTIFDIQIIPQKRKHPCPLQRGVLTFVVTLVW